jgi:excisionase family DNA binding protein
VSAVRKPLDGPDGIEDLFSVPEVARKLGGISPWTVRAWLTQGKLKRTKVGGRTMVSESAIAEFLDKCNK